MFIIIVYLFTLTFCEIDRDVMFYPNIKSIFQHVFGDKIITRLANLNSNSKIYDQS